MSNEKLEVGDSVEIVEYGNVISKNDEAEVITEDSMPELVGQKGIIDQRNKFNKYAVKGIVGKYAWFNKDQLKKI
jgi:hypothetical protein